MATSERDLLMAEGAVRIERGAGIAKDEKGENVGCAGGGSARHDGRCKKPHPSGAAWTDKSGRPIPVSEDGAAEGKFVGEIHYWFADAAGHFAGDYDGWGELEPAEILATRVPATVDCAVCGPSALRILDKATNAKPTERPKTAAEIQREADEARFAALSAKDWTSLDLAEQTEATNLGFKLGRYVPAITALA